MKGAKSMLKAAALAMGLTLVWTSPAPAFVMGNDAAGAAETKDKAAKDPSRKVCRNIVVSGSRLSTRSCRTQEDWDRAEQEAQEGALRQQLGPGYRPDPPSPGASSPR